MPDRINTDAELLKPSKSPAEPRRSRVRAVLKYTARVMTVLLSTIFMIVCALLGVILVIVRGPSSTAQRLFVLTVKETSAAGFLANIFLSDAEVGAILLNVAPNTEEKTDPALVEIPNHGTGDEDDYPESGDNSVTDSVEEIEIIDIKGSTYHGKMIIVRDPRRVFLGTPEAFGADKSGLTLRQMISEYDALGGINGGGFVDPNGTGTGGIPDGIVIRDGRLAWGEADSAGSMIGFDGDGILHVGYMTGQSALDAGIVEGVTFGPPLIINGKPLNEKHPIGGGLNPRTAIGQRADGAVLLLVIEGRQITSLGVTYDDLAYIMFSYGAVNAGNLDGGSSSLMVWDGESITKSAYVYGERVLATAFLVR